MNHALLRWSLLCLVAVLSLPAVGAETGETTGGETSGEEQVFETQVEESSIILVEDTGEPATDEGAVVEEDPANREDVPADGGEAPIDNYEGGEGEVYIYLTSFGGGEELGGEGVVESDGPAAGDEGAIEASVSIETEVETGDASQALTRVQRGSNDDDAAFSSGDNLSKAIR